MTKNLKEKMQILIRKYEYKKFQEVVNDSMVILKKNNNDFVWNLVGLSFQKLFNIESSINCFENARDIFKLGVEKIILKSLFYKNIDEVKKLIENFGSQSICLNIDYKYNKFFKRYSQIDNNNMKQMNNI